MLAYRNILTLLEQQLASVSLESKSIFEEIHIGVYACKGALDQLRRKVKSKAFKNLDEECYFFKNIKPQVVGKLIFFIELATIEKSKPHGGNKEIKRYLQLQLVNLQSLFDANEDFYQYQLQKRTDRDKEYFSRANAVINFHYNALFYYTDGDFSTSHDLLAARFMAHQQLIKYYSNKLFNLHDEKYENSLDSKLKWTGKKVDLVELVYALQASNMINNGNVGIKELAKKIETLFSIELGDYYRIFLEIRMRKNNPTKLLDFLKTCIKNKIIEADG